MATKKAGGTAKNLNDSKPKYLGVKLYAGEKANPGSVIIRQRGTRYTAGKNTQLGKDHTIFAVKPGIVSFKNKRKIRFDGTKTSKKEVNVN
jgi:large subunit ribosomal protein L27